MATDHIEAFTYAPFVTNFAWNRTTEASTNYAFGLSIFSFVEILDALRPPEMASDLSSDLEIPAGVGVAPPN